MYGMWMLLSGFLIKKNNIPDGWIWMHYLSFQKYAFEGLSPLCFLSLLFLSPSVTLLSSSFPPSILSLVPSASPPLSSSFFLFLSGIIVNEFTGLSFPCDKITVSGVEQCACFYPDLVSWALLCVVCVCACVCERVRYWDVTLHIKYHV